MQLRAHRRSGSRVEAVERVAPRGSAWEREWAEAEATDRAEAAGARARPYSVRQLVVLGVALLSAGAAAVHFAVSKDHLEEYLPFGVLFLVAAVTQLGWAAWVIVRPSRALLLLGAAVNLSIAAVWAVDRTVGLPIGPEHWKAEPVGFGDGASTAFEVLIAAGCLMLLRRRLASGVPRSAAAVLVLVAGAATILALLSALGAASSFLTPAA